MPSSKNPFEDESVQANPFILILKQAMGDEGERFWQADGKFVSMEALRSDAEPVTVVLSRTQWSDLFWNAIERRN